MDQVRERGALLPGKDKKHWGNHDIIVNGIWREIFSLKVCLWGRKHFVHLLYYLYSFHFIINLVLWYELNKKLQETLLCFPIPGRAKKKPTWRVRVWWLAKLASYDVTLKPSIVVMALFSLFVCFIFFNAFTQRGCLFTQDDYLNLTCVILTTHCCWAVIFFFFSE